MNCEQYYFIPRSTVKRDHLICKLCKYQSKSSSDLDTHLQKHKRTLPMLLDSVYYFRCGRCNAVFMTVNDLNLHLDGIDSNPCVVSTTHEFCTDYQFLDDDDDDDEDRMDSGESLDDANNIDSLQRICSGIRIGDQMVLCNWCQEFQGSSAMEIWDHYVEAHFQLDASGETAEMSDSRATYCASFSDVHKCGYCDQTFRTLKDSIPHVFFHARSFGCPFPSCSDTYLRFHLLNYHMESKHLEVDKHQCEHCHLEMDSYAQKRRHMRYDCPERNYDCSKCSKYWSHTSRMYLGCNVSRYLFRQKVLHTKRSFGAQQVPPERTSLAMQLLWKTFFTEWRSEDARTHPHRRQTVSVYDMRQVIPIGGQPQGPHGHARWECSGQGWGKPDARFHLNCYFNKKLLFCSAKCAIASSNRSAFYAVIWPFTTKRSASSAPYAARDSIVITIWRNIYKRI